MPGFNVPNLVGTGTDQELLDLIRAAIARIGAYGQYRTTDGRMLNEASLPELRRTADWLEARIAAATTTASRSRTVIARRNRPA